MKKIFDIVIVSRKAVSVEAETFDEAVNIIKQQFQIPENAPLEFIEAVTIGGKSAT